MKLTEKEQRIYELRNEGKTLEEVAEEMGITKERVRQVEKNIRTDLSNLHFCFKMYDKGFFEKPIHVITDEGFDYALHKAVERANEICKRSVKEHELSLYFVKDMEGDNIEFNCSRKYICCICGEEHIGYGHNPNPVTIDGECCDKCNMSVVIPTRLKECIKRNV